MQILTWAYKHLWLILAISFSLYLGRMVATPNHFHTHDDLQVFRTNEFLQCLKDKQLPCRWSKDMGKGYGYPYFIFYPPMIYAMTSVIVMVGQLPITYALNIFAFLCFPLAAYAMYYLVKTITKRRDLAALGSMLYTLLPYHAVNVFVRGVYAENLVWSLAPLLFAEVYLVIKTRKSGLLLSILLAIILLTHNISAMLLVPLLAIWGIGVTLTDRRHLLPQLWRTLPYGMLGVGLSAFYLIPVILEKGLVQTESMIFDYYSYLVHFPTFRQLFISNYWGYGGSGWGQQFDEMSFSVGQVQWVTLLVICLVLLIFFRHKLRQIIRSPLSISLGLMLGAMLFLSHSRSTAIWELLTPLQYIQFPWRLVGLVGLFMLTLASYLLHYLPPKLGRALAIISVGTAFVLYQGYFKPVKYDYQGDQYYLTGSMRQEQQNAHIYDYLPNTVHSLPDFASQALNAQVPVNYTVNSWSSNTLDLQVTGNAIAQKVTVSIFDYPGWVLNLNGQSTAITADPQSGLISFALPPGDSHVQLRFVETPLRAWSNLISILTMLLTAILAVSSYLHSKVE